MNIRNLVLAALVTVPLIAAANEDSDNTDNKSITATETRMLEAQAEQLEAEQKELETLKQLVEGQSAVGCIPYPYCALTNQID